MPHLRGTDGRKSVMPYRDQLAAMARLALQMGKRDLAREMIRELFMIDSFLFMSAEDSVESLYLLGGM